MTFWTFCGGLHVLLSTGTSQNARECEAVHSIHRQIASPCAPADEARGRRYEDDGSPPRGTRAEDATNPLGSCPTLDDDGYQYRSNCIVVARGVPRLTMSKAGQALCRSNRCHYPNYKFRRQGILPRPIRIPYFTRWQSVQSRGDPVLRHDEPTSEPITKLVEADPPPSKSLPQQSHRAGSVVL
jgi:hypothetical protein